MSDKRSKTSRANLGNHVPEPLSPAGTIAVGVRLPSDLLERVDATAASQGLTRSEWLRQAIEAKLS